MTLFARLILALAGLALLGAIVWAGGVKGANLLSEGAQILALPWGAVTLIDLYVGFVVGGVVILAVERNKLLALAWVLPIFVLGNVVTVIWAIVRLPVLLKLRASGEKVESGFSRS